MQASSETEDEEYEVAVEADQAGGRLDAVLAKALDTFSRTRQYQVLDAVA